jgi:DUF1680 family protein
MNRPHIELYGLLGEALAANASGRLAHFVVDETSPAIALFDAEHAQHNHEGDWYGEHAGKWLIAAAKAAARTRDEELAARVRRVADYLVARQDSDGYLGTYAPERRFTVKHPPKPKSWNGEPVPRTWDIWIHSYLVLGLLEVHAHFPDRRYLEAARRIGDLAWSTLTDGGIDICELGNHHGMSATVLLDAAVDLHGATREPRYLDLAQRIAEQAEANPDLALLRHALAGADASEIATGKAYQLLWNLVGIAKLHRATANADLLRAVERLWQSVRDHHLTLGGGPWGGVAHRSREVFNAPVAFSPEGYVETCSTLAWIQLNRELLFLSDDPKYAEEIERSAYNDLLGAQAPDGEDWCYYVFPNGRRVHTTYWRCCKSSGAMALEELPAVAVTRHEDTVTVNLYGPGRAGFAFADGTAATLEQQTDYPASDIVEVAVDVDRARRFALRLRIPQWAAGARVHVDGQEVEDVVPGTYCTIDRLWRRGDRVVLSLPMLPVLQRRSNRNVQESRAPDGAAIHQEVLRRDYVAVTRGPLVYATTLIDGFKTDETVRLPTNADGCLHVVPGAPGDAPSIEMTLGYRSALLFEPYFRAGGRVHGAWRLTWLSLAPAPPD